MFLSSFGSSHCSAITEHSTSWKTMLENSPDALTQGSTSSASTEADSFGCSTEDSASDFDNASTCGKRRSSTCSTGTTGSTAPSSRGHSTPHRSSTYTHAHSHRRSLSNSPETDDEGATSPARRIASAILNVPLSVSALTVGKAAEVTQILSEPLLPTEPIPLGLHIQYYRSHGGNRIRNRSTSDPKGKNKRCTSTSWQVSLSKSDGLLTRDVESILRIRGLRGDKVKRRLRSLVAGTIDRSLRRLELMRMKHGQAKAKLKHRNISDSNKRKSKSGSMAISPALKTQFPQESFVVVNDFAVQDAQLQVQEGAMVDPQYLLSVTRGGEHIDGNSTNLKGGPSSCSSTNATVTQLQLPKSHSRGGGLVKLPYRLGKQVVTTSLKLQKALVFGPSMTVTKQLVIPTVRFTMLDGNPFFQLFRRTLRSNSPGYRLGEAAVEYYCEVMAWLCEKGVGAALSIVHSLQFAGKTGVRTVRSYLAWADWAVRRVMLRSLRAGLRLTTNLLSFGASVPAHLFFGGGHCSHTRNGFLFSANESRSFPITTGAVRRLRSATTSVVSQLAGLTMGAVDALVPPKDVIPSGTRIDLCFASLGKLPIRREWSVKVSFEDGENKGDEHEVEGTKTRTVIKELDVDQRHTREMIRLVLEEEFLSMINVHSAIIFAPNLESD
ncbi:unnamed protein product [Amoebophrya sp. A25]|nr:unnamed protein product [Amoebophrya sp. A25]|eukprot:GSA25T00014684001.1